MDATTIRSSLETNVVGRRVQDHRVYFLQTSKGVVAVTEGKPIVEYLVSIRKFGDSVIIVYVYFTFYSMGSAG